MAEERPAGDPSVPPVGEEVHLPGPTYLPVMTAFGITIALVGVVLSWIVFGIGAAITAVAILRWVGETREDVARLPLDH